jgi:hypothetical protein
MTTKSSGREARLAKALRENLKRRKARDRPPSRDGKPEAPAPGQPNSQKAPQTR